MKKIKIFVAGHRGMVGSSIIRNLKKIKMRSIFVKKGIKPN